MAAGIYKAMCEVMKTVKAAPKTGKVESRGGRREVLYNYRSIDDICNALHGVLAEHGVFPVPEVLAEEVGVNGVNRYVRLHVAYTFYHTDGSSVRCVVHSEALDNSDKATAKAMTMAYKYALSQVFCLATEEDGDRERLGNHDERAEKKAMRPVEEEEEQEEGEEQSAMARQDARADEAVARQDMGADEAVARQSGLRNEVAARQARGVAANEATEQAMSEAMYKLESAAGKGRPGKRLAFQPTRDGQEELPEWLAADDELAPVARAEQPGGQGHVGLTRKKAPTVRELLHNLKLRYMQETGLEDSEARRRLIALMRSFLHKEIRMDNLSIAELGEFDLYLEELLKAGGGSFLKLNAYMTDEDKEKVAEAQSIMRYNDMSERDFLTALGNHLKRKVTRLSDFSYEELANFGNCLLMQADSQASLMGL